MPARKEQNYYCVVKREKFGDYELIIRKGTNGGKITTQLKKEGFRVMRCMNAKFIKLCQSFRKSGYFYNGRQNTSMPHNALVFIREIELLEEDKTNEL